MNARKFFTEKDQLAIKNAIAQAEKQTSGEIRVHIEDTFTGDVLDQASFIFKKLKMHKTEYRNGVLFYLAIRNRKFAIIGDAGINSKVPEGFWDLIKEIMTEHFRNNRFTEGLAEGIKLAGEKLIEHYPYLQNDTNELSDEISFGK
ncbi:MAG: TPM domain-containing protein [Bacteroidia bacterium]|nr:TPM domain-containing protein [Bacteroidia bacterium]